MISYVKGDLIKRALNKEYDVIVHGCNCQRTMGAGIALTIRNTFTKAYEADIRSNPVLGKFSHAEYPKLGKTNILYVINLYSQQFPGSGSLSYDAIYKGFTDLNHIFQGRKIGIPKIGAGIAGGNWNIIEKIIDECTPDCEVEVVIFEG